ncbi:hypothetical protein IW261DRAFT_1425796 [Armillaria novae-zelandiae]|uniref:Uncharacterized protein n=1 Tax=Armillaria novae-zelandiae TaxID=153914 RepID=A0AA39NSH6_9AGAR|nr:hypothetical protein IW261DRAFT_1425796 [Armillaria novae-zelandiae]
MVPEETAIAKSKSPGAFTWDDSNDAMPWLMVLLKMLSGASSLCLTSFQEVLQDDVLPLAEPIITSDGQACSIALVDYLTTFTTGGNLGVMEMQSVVTELLRHFEFSVLKGAPELQHGPVVLPSIPWFWGKQKKDHSHIRKGSKNRPQINVPLLTISDNDLHSSAPWLYRQLPTWFHSDKKYIEITKQIKSKTVRTC